MITVIADDLTGAAEIAGVCLRHGLNVIFGINSIPKNNADVCVIATDTRSLKEKEAYSIHHRLAVEIIQTDKNAIIFKKCDSALRGFVLTELKALKKVTGKTKILLQPANPANERYILSGSYIINDQLIENTGFAYDPDFPSITSLVKNLITYRSSMDVDSDIYTGVIDSISLAGIYIPDCRNIAELKKCVEMYTPDMTIAGSAALFEQFILHLGICKSSTSNTNFEVKENFLLLSGSTQPESIHFTNKMANKNCPVTQFENEFLEKKLDENGFFVWTDNLISLYNKNKKIVLRISDKIIRFKNSSKILKHRLSISAKKIIENVNVEEILIEGGATAYDLLNELNWNSFTPVNELTAGVVRMRNDQNPKIHITVKPGSYKWPENLIN